MQLLYNVSKFLQYVTDFVIFIVLFRKIVCIGLPRIDQSINMYSRCTQNISFMVYCSDYVLKQTMAKHSVLGNQQIVTPLLQATKTPKPNPVFFSEYKKPKTHVLFSLLPYVNNTAKNAMHTHKT